MKKSVAPALTAAAAALIASDVVVMRGSASEDAGPAEEPPQKVPRTA
jgi:hypothetical protein